MLALITPVAPFASTQSLLIRNILLRENIDIIHGH